jgi:hypothetical protein
MSNHVHLVVIPQKAEGLALVLKETHGRYATYRNPTSRAVWQVNFWFARQPGVFRGRRRLRRSLLLYGGASRQVSIILQGLGDGITVNSRTPPGLLSGL